LVEATTGNHVWGERYDRNIAELFAVQDEVVQAIVARIAGELTIFEFDKARRKRTEHLAAYDCHLRGLDYWRFNSDEANIESTKWFEKALELDPDYAEPLARLSINTAVGAVESGSAEQLERAQTMANKAVALDPNNSWSHCALGLAKLFGRSLAASADHFQSAMRLNPNDPDQLIFCSTYYIYAGKFDAAREVIAAALRLNPLPPIWYNTTSGVLQYGLRRYADAALLFEQMENNTACWHHYYLAACYERLGKSAEAKDEIEKALRLKPDLSIGFIKLIDPYARPDDLENLLEPLRKLGLPA
jgi:tetratricopeptide (TPR) repeat protein